MSKDALIRLVLATVVAAALAAAPAAHASEPTAVLYELRLAEGGELLPIPRSRVAVTADTTYGEAKRAFQAVWANAPGEETWRNELASVLELSGLTGAEALVRSVTPDELAWSEGNAVRLTQSGSEARAVVDVDGPVLWDMQAGDCSLVFAPGLQRDAGPGRPGVPKPRVPPRTVLTVRVIAPGDGLRVARPLPTRATDDGVVEWRFGPQQSIEPVCVGIDAGPFALGGDPPPRTTKERVLEFLRMAGFALPLTAILGPLGVLLVLRRFRGDRLFSGAARPVRLLARVAVVFGVAVAVAQAVRFLCIRIEIGTPEDWRPETWLRAAGEAFAGGIAMAVLLWAAGSLTNDPLPRPRWIRRLAGLVPVAAVVALPLLTVPEEQLSTPWWDVAVLAAAAVACVTAFALLVRAVWHVLLRGIPVRWTAMAGRPPWSGRMGWIGTTVVVVFVALAAWSMWRRVDFGPDGFSFDEAFDAVARWPSEFALTLLQPLALATAVLSLGLTLVLLRGRSDHAPAPPELELPRRAAGLVAVVFAAAVVMSGSSAGALLPITSPARAGLVEPSLQRSIVVPLLLFVLAVLAVRVTLAGGRSAARSLRREPGDLVRRAVRQEHHTREIQALYARFEKGELRPSAYFEQQDPLVAGDEPPEVERALARGPAGTWRGNLRVALELAPRLAIVPMVYVAYVVISRQLPSAVGELNAFGALYLVADLAGEALFWLAAAATLILLYPYLPFRTGPLKGVVLAILFLIPHGIVAVVVPGAENLTVWSFVAGELALFLMALGVTIDYRTLRADGVYWRHLIDLYRLRNARVVVGYAVPVIVAFVTVVEQIGSGNAPGAVTELLNGVGAIP